MTEQSFAFFISDFLRIVVLNDPAEELVEVAFNIGA